MSVIIEQLKHQPFQLHSPSSARRSTHERSRSFAVMQSLCVIRKVEGERFLFYFVENVWTNAISVSFFTRSEFGSIALYVYSDRLRARSKRRGVGYGRKQSMRF